MTPSVRPPPAHAARRIALAVALCGVAACGTAPRIDQPAKPAEIEPPRPVISVERAQMELLAVNGLLKARQWRQAEVTLEEILKARSDLPEAHFNLGWLRQRADRHTAAIEHFQAGLALAPGNPRAYNLLGLSQRETGHFAAAEQSFLRAIALAPDFDKPYRNLGILYELYLKQRAPALAQYRAYQSLQTTPDPRVAQWIAWLEKEGKSP